MQINIDYSKCTSPLDCAMCLKVCSEAVFRVKPARIEKFKETKSEDYKLFPYYNMLCTGCMNCVKVCPAGALEIRTVA